MTSDRATIVRFVTCREDRLAIAAIMDTNLDRDFRRDGDEVRCPWKEREARRWEVKWYLRAYGTCGLEAVVSDFQDWQRLPADSSVDAVPYL